MANSLNVKTGDKVLVIAGKDNGKIAKVLLTSPKTNRVVVEGVNIATKHKKARKQDEKSKIVKVEAPLNASNVMVICPSCNKATKVAHSIIAGKKHRVCKKCGESLDIAAKKEAKKAVKKEVKAEKEVVATEVASKAKTTKAAAPKTTAKKTTVAPKATKEKTAVKTTVAKTTTKVATRKTAPSSGK